MAGARSIDLGSGALLPRYVVMGCAHYRSSSGLETATISGRLHFASSREKDRTDLSEMDGKGCSTETI
jgi:hypothetical protein